MSLDAEKDSEHIVSVMATEVTSPATSSMDDQQDLEKTGNDAPNYLSGWRLHLLTVALCLTIFLVNFEISVVSTSLVSITNDLGGFGQSSWVVTAYLMIYTSFLVIVAKLSDVFGRKTVLMISVIDFAIASGACGAAQTMIQLIVFRAFQGLGSAGVYSLVLIILFEMVPPERYPKYSVLVTGIFAISLMCGPLVGGGINIHTTWRWIFLLNVPAGAVGIIILIMSMPNNFPNHGKKIQKTPINLRRIDVIGALLMLAALILLINGFEQASNFSTWTSAKVLAPILLSLPVWAAFILFERHLTKKDGVTEAVFPWRFCRNRVIIGLLINSFLVGGVFTTCVIQIPLRFQAVNGQTAWQAGVKLIPFSMVFPFGAGLGAALAGKRRMPAIHLLFVGAFLQTISLVFMARLSLDKINWSGQYGLQVVAGLGAGLGVGMTTLITPFVIEKRDLAVATAAIVQFRILGGALTLAIVTAVMNNWVQDTLRPILPSAELQAIFHSTKSIASLGEPLQTVVKGAFVKGFDLQFHILLGLAVAQFPATLLMWKREQVRIA